METKRRLYLRSILRETETKKKREGRGDEGEGRCEKTLSTFYLSLSSGERIKRKLLPMSFFIYLFIGLFFFVD